MQIGIAEFLEKVSKLKTDKEKVEALKYNDSVPLRIIFQGCFDPNVRWLLPEGKPPYKANELVDQEHILIREAEKIRYYVDGFYPSLNPKKREMMFIELLERVTPKDAELLCSVKDKKFPYKGLNVRHVLEAFPDLIPNYQPPIEDPVKEEDVNALSTFPEKSKIVCPHCGREGKTQVMMNKYHFDNCKLRKEEQVTSNEQI